MAIKVASNTVISNSLELQNILTLDATTGITIQDMVKAVNHVLIIRDSAGNPVTFDAKIDGKKAYETRGKWEVKNDFMAGPFLNYTVVDKQQNRLIVFEGFTYAPSINKREFVFELEAIAKSMKIQ